MRKQLNLLLFFSMLSLVSNAQKDSTSTIEVEKVFAVVDDIIPEIPACEGLSDFKQKQKCFSDELMKRIYKHLEYPELARKHKVEGKAVVQVRIDKDKNLFCTNTLRDIGAGTSGAAVRATNLALQELLPHYSKCIWPRSKVRGNPVRTYWNVPITFKL